MKLSHRIRFIAPAYAVRSLDVDLRRISDDMGHSVAEDPIFRGCAERVPEDDFVPENSLLEELANCLPTTGGVKRFLMRHGPLWECGTDGNFFVLLAQFVADQQQFRHTWDQAMGLPADEEPYLTLERKVEQSRNFSHQVAVNGIIEFRSNDLVFRSQTLYAALVFKLIDLAQKRKLRRCNNPRCTQLRYFVADHPKARYCSDICSAWAQTEAKRIWWEEKGDDWRKNRATQTPRKAVGKNSAQKRISNGVNETR